MEREKLKIGSRGGYTRRILRKSEHQGQKDRPGPTKISQTMRGLLLQPNRRIKNDGKLRPQTQDRCQRPQQLAHRHCSSSLVTSDYPQLQPSFLVGQLC